MADLVPCRDCGSALKRLTPTSYECPNNACPGGSIHYLCGFCNKPSFSLDQRCCTNPACRTNRLRREACPSCGNLSLISLHGSDFCINRRCPSNSDRLTTCPVCGSSSLIRLELFDICVKSTCRSLLQPNMKTLPLPAANQTFIAPSMGNIGKTSPDLPAPAPIPAAPPPVPVAPQPPPKPAAEEDPYGLDSQTNAESPTRSTQALKRPQRPAVTAPDPPVADKPAVALPSDPAARPVPQPTQPPVATVAAPSGDPLPEIEQAYAFVQRTVLAAPDQSVAPIILVFGLAGSGKSTYLTMLGDILANGAGKYHFPYPGVGVRAVRLDQLIDDHGGSATPKHQRDLLHRRVKDLIYEYAADRYNEHLVNGTWVPATVRETGSEGTAHSFFLLTEIVRDGATLGRLLTIETSGEDYQEVLRNLGRIRSVEELSSPLHRVLFKLIDAATGIIVLLDPGSPDNDQDYAPFLRNVKDEIEGRAAHALAQAVDRELQAGITPEPTQEPANLQAVLAQEDADTQKRAAFEAARLQLASELRELAATIAAVPQTHEGVATLASRHQPFLDELELLMRQVSPDFVRHAEEKFASHGRTAGNYLFYYDGMLKVLRDDQLFRQTVRMRLSLAEVRTKQTDQVILRLTQKRGIKEPLHEAFLQRWAGKQASRRMENLRYLSLVVTKSDRHPIVYPPSDYPKFKLPTCSNHLLTLDTYLNLLGGFLRCYNATAIGYAVHRGSHYAPGPGNSFTPVNIVEPLFDMLLAEAAER